MVIDVLTGFPEVFRGLINSSIIRRAMLLDAVEIWVHDLRHYALDRHGTIDDAPFGGGPGMVLMAPPVWRALENLSRTRDGRPMRIYLTPQGELLAQSRIQELAGVPWIILLCGHYKDVDARVFERDQWQEVSVGDYVLSGGETAAAVLADAIIRLLPGAISDRNSADSDSFSDGLLDAPYYTRPEEADGLTVPPVLLSGHHENIRKWRFEQRVARTRKRRPDLWRHWSNAQESKTDKPT